MNRLCLLILLLETIFIACIRKGGGGGEEEGRRRGGEEEGEERIGRGEYMKEVQNKQRPPIEHLPVNLKVYLTCIALCRQVDAKD